MTHSALGYGADTEVQCQIDQEFMSLSIMDGKKSFDIDGDKFKPGISIGNSEVGLASLSINAFILRLVCSNGMISRTEIGKSFRHVSTKILSEFPKVLDQVSVELGSQKQQFRISMESPVDDPESTINTFNRQFNLNNIEKEAAHWGYSKELGDTMFHIIQGYTRGAQFEDLSAESSYKLQRAGGNILAMVSN